MSKPEGKELGALLQAYARACLGGNADLQAANSAGARIERELRDRIDVLGADVERLLAVDANDALAELEALETEAAREDAGSQSMAHRANTEAKVRRQDPANRPGRANRVRSPGHRGHR
jgi:hypothetical protein